MWTNFAERKIKMFALFILLAIIFMPFAACGETGKAKIFGTVKDNGKPIPKTLLAVLDESTKELFGSVFTNADGQYELEVKAADSYIISANPLDFENTEQGFTYYNYMTLNKLIKRNGRDSLNIDFNLASAGNIILKAFDAQGNLVRKKDLRGNVPSNWTWLSYVTTWEDSPALGVLADVYDNYSKDKSWDIETSVAVLLAPLNVPRIINALFWEVPGFGKIWLKADNQGKGFMLTQAGDVLVINMNFELAKTKNRKLTERYELLKSSYKFSNNVTDGIKNAADSLNKAANAKEDKERAALSDESLKLALWAGETLELEKARQDIEVNRKGMALLTIRD